jgi:hypothetical protein
MSPQSESRPRMSEVSRLVNVFFEPKAAFADIAARPRPWVPILLMIAMGIGFATAVSQHIGFERVAQQAMDSSPRTQNLSAEEKQKAIEMQMKFMPVMTYVGAVLGTPVMLLIVSGVMMLIFKVMMGADIAFRQMFSIAAYSWLPGLVSVLAGLVVMFLKNADDFNIQNPTVFNAGAFLDPQTHAKWLVTLGTSLDLFTIWIIVLLALGISTAARGVSWGKALAGVAAPWLLWVIAKVGLAAIF